MATYSEIAITFTSDWLDGARLAIVSKFNKTFITQTFAYVPTRTASGYVTTGTPTGIVGETSAINFKTAFDLDYPTGYETSIVDNTVTIKSETLIQDFIRTYNQYPDKGSLTVVISNYLEDANQHKLKYYVSYCDDFGTNRNVFINKKGHTGGATELKADVNPISITYESSEDFKFSPIRPSQAEIFMIFGGADGVDFEEFWTADERMFKVEDVKDGTVEWSGYVSNSGFQYEFKGGLYYASITANDGLSTLENLAFVGDNQKPYGNPDQGLVYNNGFEFPFSLIITEILKKLKLDLDLWSCIDSYETTMTKVGDVREADPLSASYVNVKTYIKLIEDKDTPYWFGSGEEWNCKEVLENILYIFGAKLYQEWGVWRVKSVNADIDFGSGDTQRYWRKYNTVGTYLGNYEVVDDEVNITCNTEDKLMIGNDHVMSMDEVYKAFRMNYEYTFVRDGDSSVNTIRNGNFLDFDDASVYSAPLHWQRVKAYDGNHDWLRVKSVDVSIDEFTKAVEFGSQATGTSTTGTTDKLTPYSGLITMASPNIKNGDSMFLDIWQNYTYKHNNTGIWKFDTYTIMYRCIVVATDDDGEIQKYYLRNGDIDTDNGFVWQLSDSKDGDIFNDTTCFYLEATRADNYDSANDEIDFWYNHKFELPKAPASGTVYFMIHGTAIKPSNIRGRTYPTHFPCFELKNGIYSSSTKWRADEIYTGSGYSVLDPQTPQVTGVLLGIIPSGEDIPDQYDYIYNNDNQNYSLQVDPITIYNGDVQDEKHLSNIIVPTNTGGSKNFWDDLSDSYGSSSLGLLTVREIMRQYAKPYRILEGTIKIQDARFGSVYTFDTIPNVRFTLQRGAFNKQKQYIEDATFVQLTSDVLPNGGTEGGHSLDANWQPTGKSWCRVGGDALNDGYVVIEEVDINPNSETYQETQEVPSDSQDLTQCPLGQPRQYYFGSDDAILETADLSFAPITEVSDNEVQVDFDNEEGNYLYFVHLKSIGVVEKITTPTSVNNVLADWVYLADETIDGYIYRVLRTDYVMTEFTGFTHNFKFN